MAYPQSLGLSSKSLSCVALSLLSSMTPLTSLGGACDHLIRERGDLFSIVMVFRNSKHEAYDQCQAEQKRIKEFDALSTKYSSEAFSDTDFRDHSRPLTQGSRQKIQQSSVESYKKFSFDNEKNIPLETLRGYQSIR